MGNKTYKTKDLPLSAVLLINKVKLLNVKRQNGVCWFEFEDESKCSKLSNSYLFGELLVNVREYEQTIKRLKHIIFSL